MSSIGASDLLRGRSRCRNGPEFLRLPKCHELSHHLRVKIPHPRGTERVPRSCIEASPRALTPASRTYCVLSIATSLILSPRIRLSWGFAVASRTLGSDLRQLRVSEIETPKHLFSCDCCLRRTTSNIKRSPDNSLKHDYRSHI